MSTEMWREQIGAYALGGLEGDELAAFEAHLEGCLECRAEADALKGTATLLAKADVGRVAAPSPQPSAQLSERLERQIATERKVARAGKRRRRWFAGGGVAVAATAAALLALTILPSSSSDNPPAGNDNVEQVSFSGLPKGVGINAALEPETGGTAINMEVWGMPSGTLCRVFVRQEDGSLVSAGSFRYVYSRDGNAKAILSTAVDRAEMRALVVHAGPRRFEQSLPA